MTARPGKPLARSHAPATPRGAAHAPRLAVPILRDEDAVLRGDERHHVLRGLAGREAPAEA